MRSFLVHFNEKNKTPKYIQLYEYIKKDIVEGRWKKGDRLPSIRHLASELKISKTTVENAYAQLVVEGYIESRYKSGYLVSDFETLGLDYFKATAKEQKKKVPYRPVENNGESSDENSFSFIEWKKAISRVLDYQSSALLSYGDVQGEYALRCQISKFIHNARGGNCEPEQIIVGAGIQYLFGLIATLFRGKNESIAFEYPGFSKGMYIFEDYGYLTEKISVETDGISIEALKRSDAKIVYVSPSHQYPTGSVMPIKKRLQLLSWAKEQEAYIIEDDYDSLLRYEGYPVPALQGLSQGEKVIYVGSFSKLLTPALRISFMILPPSLMPLYNALKSRYSQSVSKIEQLALANYMEDGSFDKHLRKIKKIYGKKNQLLIEAFNNNPCSYFQLVGKESGLHVVLKFSENVDLQTVVNRCKEECIVLEGVEGDEGNRILVFHYSGIRDQEIHLVVSKLVRLTKESVGIPFMKT